MCVCVHVCGDTHVEIYIKTHRVIVNLYSGDLDSSGSHGLRLSEVLHGDQVQLGSGLTWILMFCRSGGFLRRRWGAAQHWPPPAHRQTPSSASSSSAPSSAGTQDDTFGSPHTSICPRLSRRGARRPRHATCSFSSVSCVVRVVTTFIVAPSLSCNILISFCSPSPSVTTRDIACIRGNQSRLLP